MANKGLDWIKASLGKMGFGASKGRSAVTPDEVDRAGFEFGETLSTASLMGSASIQARTRQLIYDKYQQMMADPVVSGALRLHVTSALGGHETSGDLVFIEAAPHAKQDKQALKLVEELADDLMPLFNEVAQLMAYNGVGFGDAYARMYTEDKVGVVDLQVDEMLLPPLVQPYEKGGKTVVCSVAVGNKAREKLVMDQVARLKMPRLMYTPQPMAIEKAWRTRITENDLNALPLMPSLAGGSFLADAETQFDKFQAAMQGLVGQRVLDSIDESIFAAQVQGLNADQRTQFVKSLTGILKASKDIAEKALSSGKPIMSRFRHILPVYSEKQLVQVQAVNAGGGSGSGRAGNIGVEDVVFHAKMLSGALGIDLTMLGFADLMSGGLGEGGFFRTSAQSAERSRTIRVALAQCFSHIADVHVAYKHGMKFEGRRRPWVVNFYGSMSALESERTRTQLDAMTAGATLTMTLQQLRDIGMDAAAMQHLLETIMKLDAEDAKVYAQALEKAKKEADKKEAAQGGFGGGEGFDQPGGPGEPGGPGLPGPGDEGGGRKPAAEVKRPVIAEG